MAMMASAGLFAQQLSDAIKLTTNEQFEKADAAFKALIQSQPNNGEYYFYYGENFFLNDNLEKANEMYQKGADVNATNPFPYIGLGKVQWYRGKQTEAKANLYKATTLAGGKNATVLMKIAEVYIYGDNKSLPDALTLLAQAAKLDPKNPEIFIVTGDAYLEQNEGTKAIENYEKAGSMDPKSVKAILRQGQVWNRAKNYNLAIEKYKQAEQIDPSFAPAYREMAEIYLRAGQYQNAADNAKRYIDLNNDCSALGRYAGMANLAKKYKESLDAALQAQKCDPKNNFLNRYIAYDDLELKDYPNGLVSINALFTNAASNPDFKLIPQDYETRAKLNAQNGNDSLAVLDLKKAYELDTTRKDLYNDLANSYMKMRKYGDAVDMYKKKMENGQPNVNDYFGMGRAYYYSKDFINADSSFADVVKDKPELAIGYLWRAKANVQQDQATKSDNWSAKPYYEQFISKVKPEEMETYKRDLVDAYTYLAAYYAKHKDCENTKANFQKVLELDPANAQAKKFMAAPCK